MLLPSLIMMGGGDEIDNLKMKTVCSGVEGTDGAGINAQSKAALIKSAND